MGGRETGGGARGGETLSSRGGCVSWRRLFLSAGGQSPVAQPAACPAAFRLPPRPTWPPVSGSCHRHTQHPVPATRHSAHSTRHPTPNTQHLTLSTQYPPPDTQHPTLSFARSSDLYSEAFHYQNHAAQPEYMQQQWRREVVLPLQSAFGGLYVQVAP
ncbi:hypothetical protein O3P69_004398 [Scylla paramamosain]|uniref:Uncharacterized protein n=1 Tax=Scylla paramamosain TaxID=85552 RepID=A0AAW0UCS3_SCYPA